MTSPENPFTLPALGEDEVIYGDSRIKTAATLAAHYIAARAAEDKERSRQFDTDIGAFLNEDFQQGEEAERDDFAMRFGALIDLCDREMPLEYHRAWLRQGVKSQ